MMANELEHTVNYISLQILLEGSEIGEKPHTGLIWTSCSSFSVAPTCIPFLPTAHRQWRLSPVEPFSASLRRWHWRDSCRRYQNPSSSIVVNAKLSEFRKELLEGRPRSVYVVDGEELGIFCGGAAEEIQRWPPSLVVANWNLQLPNRFTSGVILCIPIFQERILMVCSPLWSEAGNIPTPGQEFDAVGPAGYN